jgi:hypothetical protein
MTRENAFMPTMSDGRAMRAGFGRALLHRSNFFFTALLIALATFFHSSEKQGRCRSSIEISIALNGALSPRRCESAETRSIQHYAFPSMPSIEHFAHWYECAFALLMLKNEPRTRRVARSLAAVKARSSARVHQCDSPAPQQAAWVRLLRLQQIAVLIFRDSTPLCEHFLKKERTSCAR